MYEVDVIEDKNWKVTIFQDDDCTSPREWDQLGTMLTWDRNYNSPDENDFPTPDDFEEYWEGVECHPDYIRLPVFKLEHSGVAYRTGPFWEDPQGWDSGQVGWIYTTPEKVANTGAPKESWAEQLKNEVEEYGKWANGECYGYVVTHRQDRCECPDHEDWVLIESCGGFIGECEVGLPNEAPDKLRRLVGESPYVGGVS